MHIICIKQYVLGKFLSRITSYGGMGVAFNLDIIGSTLVLLQYFAEKVKFYQLK